jgi:hypothetical protein
VAASVIACLLYALPLWRTCPAEEPRGQPSCRVYQHGGHCRRRDLDHALESAKLIPAPLGGVEVRPVLAAPNDADGR